MRHFKFGIPILGAMTIASGLFGCADESQWGSSSNEKGRISLTLSTDSGIKTTKPVFRSEDEESTSDPNDLNTYITVPKPENFYIKLEKSDETFSKTWTTLEGFRDYAEKESFSTGAYTLTAYYGEKGKQDFNAPYFEASATFNVLSDQVYELNLTAELINSMVKVNYTDAFRDYMNDFYSSLRTEGRSNEIIFSKDETDPAFVEPNNASLTLHFTTKDKNYTADLKIGDGDFPPLAKTLHNITLDIVENDNGAGQLQVVFDDALEDEIVKVDLTEKLFTTEAPTIICTGFTDGETIEVLEKSSYPDKIRMEAFVPGMLKSAVLTIESDQRPSWGAEIDLCAATPDQIAATKEAFGEDAMKNFFFDEKDLNQNDYSVAVLDLTEFSKSLPAGKHKISLNVTDKLGRTSNTASLTLDSKPIELEVIDNTLFDYCGKTAWITIEYNSNDPLSELNFKTLSDQKNEAEISVQSCEEIAASRSIEKKQYKLELQLPDNVTAARKNISVDIYHNNVKKKSHDIAVDVPEYDLEYDEFSNHAFVKVNLKNSNDPTLLSNVVRNLYLSFDGTQRVSGVMNFDKEGYLAVSELKPGTTYEISSTITNGDSYNKHTSLKTESAQKITNGDFSEPGETISMSDLNVGGQFSIRFIFSADYQLKSSFSRVLPQGWATVNSLTAYSGASNKNTWFVVPSSWTEDGKGVMRNVGYKHNGKTPNKSDNGTSTDYYCKNTPSIDDLDKAAGELFLFNEIERTEGIPFTSRPTSISFEYDYEPLSGSNDHGYAKIELIGEDGNPLGAEPQILSLDRGNDRKISIPFTYESFGEKAAKLIVSFKSSNEDTPPIRIPDELNEENIGTPPVFKEVPVNSYHSVATGSVLKVYNVVAHYGDEETPAATPQKTTKKKR